MVLWRKSSPESASVYRRGEEWLCECGYGRFCFRTQEEAIKRAHDLGYVVEEKS